MSEAAGREPAAGAAGGQWHEAGGDEAGGSRAAPLLGLVVATEAEARPFLERFLRAVDSWGAAGRRWYAGEAGPQKDLSAAGGVRPANEAARAVLVVSGYDKANAAAATAVLVERFAPALVVNFGIAGAFPGSGLTVGDVVLATEDSYGDTGTSSPQGWLSAREFGMPLAQVGGRRYWNTFPVDVPLLRVAGETLRRAGWAVDGGGAHGRVMTGPCVTLSQVTGTAEEALVLEARWSALAESMEGAACAQMCAVYETPFLEARGISNVVGDRDRSRWDVEGAAAAAAEAVAVLCGHFAGVLRDKP